MFCLVVRFIFAVVTCAAVYTLGSSYLTGVYNKKKVANMFFKFWVQHFRVLAVCTSEKKANENKFIHSKKILKEKLIYQTFSLPHLYLYRPARFASLDRN